VYISVYNLWYSLIKISVTFASRGLTQGIRSLKIQGRVCYDELDINIYIYIYIYIYIFFFFLKLFGVSLNNIIINFYLVKSCFKGEVFIPLKTI
jgi:hypothetical protein